MIIYAIERCKKDGESYKQRQFLSTEGAFGRCFSVGINAGTFVAGAMKDGNPSGMLEAMRTDLANSDPSHTYRVVAFVESEAQ